MVGAALAGVARGAPLERARDLGVPFEGAPGPLNAITAVPGVEVGQVSLVSGEGALKVGVGPVRTGGREAIDND
jgi:L-aminopeptidase/D-esterase-like protein